MLLLFSGCMEARSINIVVSHDYKFAVDDYEPQETIKLNNIDVNVRQQLEDSLKEFQKASEVDKLPKKPKSVNDSVDRTSTTITYYKDTPYPEDTDNHTRHKRNANLAQLANRNIQDSPTNVDTQQAQELSDFEIISEEDILRGRKQRIKSILTYLGFTLLAVLGFSITAFCFLTDPKSCIIAFGTGSPCCLIICPCILHFVKRFLTPGAMIRDNTNKFIPGMMVHPDGRLETYDPTPEEIEAIMDIVDIIQDMA
ncbi:hypothetical protein SNE40_007218 [Patella caerulea]|uniref:Uncharacterized protein n=1 Tax=Patella caerulea TaxID=87958 RepID=A0AAN8JTD7_PATCE